jgi:hypothetical protein
VFGVPLGQCVEVPSSRKRSTASATTGIIENIPSSASGANQDDMLLSPVTKASRSDSRTSFGSNYEALRERSMDKMGGSIESLNTLFDLRRQSLGLSSQSSALDMDEGGANDLSMPSGTFSSPCVPTVVMMCIRHLEQFGLHTVGIFRVSSSKKRVQKVSHF